MAMFDDDDSIAMQYEAWMNAVRSAHNQSAISSSILGGGGGGGSGMLGMGIGGPAGHGGVRMSRGLEVEFGIEVARIDNGWLVRLRGSEKLTYCASAEDVGKVIVARLVDRRMNGDDEKIDEGNSTAVKPQISPGKVLHVNPGDIVGDYPPEQYGTTTYSDNTA